MAVNFGRDTSCTTELRSGRYATGVRLVAEAAFRRLTTPRGTLRGGEDEAGYGIDLLGMVGTVSTKKDAAALPGRIEAELRKDERIESVVVTVLETTVASLSSFQIDIEAVTEGGPFTLQIGIDNLELADLNIIVEAA